MLADPIATPRSPRPRPRHRFVDQPSVLQRITARGVDLVVWRRPRDPALERWCVAVAAARALEFDEVLPVRSFPAARLVSAFPVAPERERLRADLAALVAQYAAVLGCERVRAQLHVVTHQHCPRFHVDAVGVRLITTYAGPGTEWLPEGDVARVSTGALPLAGRAARQLSPFEVALMKGSAWPGNRRHGVVHRSPLVADERRLVFTLDVRP